MHRKIPQHASVWERKYSASNGKTSQKKNIFFGPCPNQSPHLGRLVLFCGHKKNNVLCVLQNRELVMMMIVVEMMISPGTKVEEHDRIIK